MRRAAPLALVLAWPLLLAALLLTAGARVADAAAAADPGRGGPIAERPIQLRGLPQPASVTATPRLRLPTGTAVSGLTPTATGTLMRVVSTAGPRDRTPGPAPEGTGTPDPGTAGGGVPGAAAATTDRFPSATTGAGTAAPAAVESADQAPPSGTAAPGRTGDSRSVTDRARAPAGLLSAPAADPGIRRRWEATGSPRTGQSWLSRLTAGRPGPWGWGLTYPLLGLAFLWAFRQVWRGIGDLRETAEGRVADGEGRP